MVAKEGLGKVRALAIAVPDRFNCQRRRLESCCIDLTNCPSADCNSSCRDLIQVLWSTPGPREELMPLPLQEALSESSLRKLPQNILATYHSTRRRISPLCFRNETDFSSGAVFRLRHYAEFRWKMRPQIVRSTSQTFWTVHPFSAKAPTQPR